MKKKVLIIIIILSFSLILFDVYDKYILRNVYFNNFKEVEEVEVLKKYNYNKVNICYGNKIKCKKQKYKVIGKINTNKIGTYHLIYQVRINNKTISKSKQVNVIDSISPIINVHDDLKKVCPNGKFSEKLVSAMDNYDGDISNNIKYKIQNGKLILSVTDSSNNSTRKEIDVEVLDDEKPIITLNGDKTLYLASGKKYEEPGFIALDNCDNNVTNKVEVINNVNNNKSGNYEIVYKVKDTSGNETISKRQVSVFDVNNYNINNLGKKVIYLTFDDGPGPYTSRLLDILAKYNVKATFFVVGYNDKYNDLMKRESLEGHTVAIHSNTHRYNHIYSSIDNYMNDILTLQEKIKNYTGVESKILRFPGGSSNTISRRYKSNIMTELAQKTEELGFRYFDWTIMSGDAGNTTDKNKIVSNVINNLKEDSPNVVLQHDIKSYSVDAVEDIIVYGLANGYTFAPITMESPVIHQKLNN